MQHDNRLLAIRWMEDSWNHRRDATIDELFAADGVGYLEGRVVRSAGDVHQMRHEVIAAFPDIHIRIEDSIADGDRVVLRWRLLGTHTGVFAGIAASRRSLDVVGTTWFRFSNGKIVEGHDTWNVGGVLAGLAA